MGSVNKSVLVVLVGIVGVLMLLLMNNVSTAIDCTTVTSLISACSSFITYGSPDPFPESPCCKAMASLYNLAHSADDRQSLCRCIMGLITTYNPNATVIATLPGFCGVSLGFTIDPTTDCN